MKPIRWRGAAAPTSLLLALLLAGCGCDSGGLRSAEPERASLAATQSMRAASGSAAEQLPAVESVSAAAPEAPKRSDTAPAKAVEQGDDALITAKVVTGLAIDRALRRSHIEVATSAGVVTLKGPAPSSLARSRAEEIARNVQGVTSVQNHLRVQPG